MNSFNHYSYGAIGDWMYREVAGIDTYEDAPGYRHSRIKPHIGGGLTQVAADLHTSYGLLSSHWQIVGDSLRMDVEIPANTSATVYLPSEDEASVREGGKMLRSEKEIGSIGLEKGYIVLNLGSGNYHFSARR
jgi:alpha-L-rhamnosidase